MSGPVVQGRCRRGRRATRAALLMLIAGAASCQQTAPSPTDHQDQPAKTNSAQATPVSPITPATGVELPELPAGVFLQSATTATDLQRAAISSKLGGTITALTNSHLTVHGSPIQVNLIQTADAQAADAVYRSMLDIKPEPFCLRRELTIIEYVSSKIDHALAIKTSYELGFLPKPLRLRYRVTARLATIETADYMACNPLFNQFLADAAGPMGSAEQQIRKLAAGFTFSKSLSLRATSLAPSTTLYAFEPPGQHQQQSGDDHQLEVSFLETSQRHGVPFVSVTIEVTVDSTGLARSTSAPGPECTRPTALWPSGSTDISSLAHRITRGKSTREQKAHAILAWLAPGKNIRYSGSTGSRWGTLKVLHQKSGHCWDFSDCFVTLCRAVGVPARQVGGWLYGSSGHVWAEYFTDEDRWQQVDPTGGGQVACGIYHIPYFTSEDGEMPIVYLAMPTIEVIPEN